MCKRTKDGVEATAAKRTSLKKVKLESATCEVPFKRDTVNLAPGTGQLKERAGFLVSRSVTLASAHV